MATDLKGGILIGALLVCSAASGLAQSREERATAKLTELFESRVDLMLEQAAQLTGLDETKLESARDALRAPVVEFFAEHEPKEDPPNPFGNDFRGVRHESFAAFLESDAWLDALAAALPEETRNVLVAERTRREQTLAAALTTQLEVMLTEGLCLTESELDGLGEVIDRVVVEQLELGVIGVQTQGMFMGTKPKSLFDRIVEAGLVDALPPERRELVQSMVSDGRDALDDYYFEVEFFVEGLEDSGHARQLLRGCAEAILHRSGKSPQSNRTPLVPEGAAEKDSFWDQALRTVLGVPDGEELPIPPSRGESQLKAPRAALLLAILDLRACLSPDQQEALAPLLEEYAEYELKGSSRRGAIELKLPSAFGLRSETVYHARQPEWSRPSVKVKSMVTTLLENCTERQREVLDV